MWSKVYEQPTVENSEILDFLHTLARLGIIKGYSGLGGAIVLQLGNEHATT